MPGLQGHSALLAPCKGMQHADVCFENWSTQMCALRTGARMLAGPAITWSANSTVLHSLVPGDPGDEQLCFKAVA